MYMEDPSVTFSSLYKDYKVECEERKVRVLSYVSFIRVVKFIMPTLHLGRTKTDSCNSCFSLDLQIRNPETSDSLREELIAAKNIHLEEAINARRAINKIIKSVKEEVAPDDPPLPEDPIYIPLCFKYPYDRVNRPFIVDYEEGTVSEIEDDGDGNLEPYYDVNENDCIDAGATNTEDGEKRKLSSRFWIRSSSPPLWGIPA